MTDCSSIFQTVPKQILQETPSASGIGTDRRVRADFECGRARPILPQDGTEDNRRPNRDSVDELQRRL
ncbi:hypothetical protein D8Y22_18925 [Salinadaptatus halalkaliphilus]|uniref:Uncharacterized protein n=1 Tax=Salinadaptatus halalkaliphilus TaxID=2419781 RepID=A0A4S3TL91_9EURY|nr:hypothetical protein D8Y22_18925 [Salinadaptatus halalkaliphilus]